MAARASTDLQGTVRGWDDLIQGLRDDLDSVVDEAVARLRAEFDTLGQLAEQDARTSLRVFCEATVDRLDRREGPDLDSDEGTFEALGELSASQGVAIDEMLASWRFLLEALRRRIRRYAAGARPDLLLEFVELATSWVDLAMLRGAAGHRRTSLGTAREAEQQRARFVRGVVLEADGGSDVELCIRFGVDPHGMFHAVRARPTVTASAEALEAFLGVGRMSGGAGGVVALVEGDLCGIVDARPSGVAPAAVGISAPVPLPGVREAFRLATRAMETAIAGGACGVFDLSGLGLRAAVLADDAIGQNLVERYVAPYRKGASGRVTLQTVERFLSNDGSLEATSKDLSVHVNTVRYRLSRFEEQTGCSLRETEGVVEVWWALQRDRLCG